MTTDLVGTNMRSLVMAGLFSEDDGEAAAIRYLETELKSETRRILMKEWADGRIPPNYRDLARLHYIIRSRRVFR